MRRVREVMQKAGLGKAEVAVGHAMWRLSSEEGGMMWTQWEDVYESLVQDVGEAAVTNLKGVWEGMSGLEYKMAKRGVLGRSWVQTMQGMGVSASAAGVVEIRTPPRLRTCSLGWRRSTRFELLFQPRHRK